MGLQRVRHNLTTKHCTFQGTVLYYLKYFLCFCVCLLCIICVKSIIILLQYSYIADCVSWASRSTLLDLWTNWICKHALGIELIHMQGIYSIQDDSWAQTKASHPLKLSEGGSEAAMVTRPWYAASWALNSMKWMPMSAVLAGVHKESPPNLSSVSLFYQVDFQ